jgi:hypothetical protein
MGRLLQHDVVFQSRDFGTIAQFLDAVRCRGVI